MDGNGTNKKTLFQICKTPKVTGPLSTEMSCLLATKRPQPPFFSGFTQPCLALGIEKAWNLNFWPLSSPDWTLWKMDPLSVCGFSLVVATMPRHGGVIVSCPLPTRLRLLGTGVPIGFQQRQKLVPYPKQDLFHGESSTESLCFWMPNRSLALPGRCM